MHSSDSMHYEKVRTALRGLRPSGPSGFEGLLTELFTALTGRRFFLAGAGYQQGRDLSTGGLGGTWIAVEAKRYQKDADLDEVSLMSKIQQLALEAPRPDIWVLAATSVPYEQTVTRLHKAGLRAGIEVAILVSPKDQPGDLDFLCASAPQVCLRYLSEDCSGALEALQEHPSYDTAVKSLTERFCAPAVGFDHARHRAVGWFRDALEASDEARARLGQPLDIFSPSGHFVRRKEAESELNSWWREWPRQSRAFVLMGEEGVGKTWATAAWAHSQMVEAQSTILIFVSSRDIESTEPSELITSHLSKITGGPHESRIDWRARLESWRARSSQGGPLFLLILDGLNERPSFEWRDLFDRLRSHTWLDNVAIVVTCRPGYWNESMFMPDQSPRTWVLGGFNDQELDEALSAYGRSRSDFVPDLIPLLRKPRYLSLALKHYDRLEETGDFTVARLLYEDWKDRLEKKRELRMTDRDFRHLLGELAQAYRDGRVQFSERELEQLLPIDKAKDLTELLTGGLLIVEDGLRQHYKIEPLWLTHSLGLLLADELNQSAPQSEIEEALAHFLEPQLEVDQQGEILAAACLYALFTPNYKQAGKQALLHTWVCRQNHTGTSVERLQTYVPIAIQDYLALLEHSTLDSSLDHRAVERIEYAVLAWRSLPKVESELLRHAARWLSLVHPKGFGYMRPPEGREGQRSGARMEAEAELRRKIEERAGNRLVPGCTVRLPGDYSLEVTDSDRLDWLADSALFFLCALPERYRVEPLRQWALSRSVIGHPREWNQVAWLLRQRSDIDFEEQILKAVDPLLKSGDITLRRAGAELLSCLGTARATEQRASLPREVRGIAQGWMEASDEDDDPCMKWHWSRGNCKRCAERADLSDQYVTSKVAAHCRDPNFKLPSAAVPRSLSALEAISLSAIWSSFVRTSSESDLESIEPTVAVAHPQMLVKAYRRVVRTQLRDEEAWRAVAHCLERVQPLLNRKPEKAVLERRWQSLLDCDPATNNQLVHWECDIFCAIIAHRTAREQLDAFLSRPSWAIKPLDLLFYFKNLNKTDISALFKSFADSTDEELERKLAFLLGQETLTLSDQDEETLAKLLDSAEDLRREVELSALQVVLRFGSEQLWEKFVLDGRLSRSTIIFFRQRWPSEQRFLHFSAHLSYESLREEIDLGTRSFLLVARDRWGEDLEDYAADLDAALHRELGRPSDPFHPLFSVGFSVPCMIKLVGQHALLAANWIEIATGPELTPSHTDFLKSTWPLYEALCEALFLQRDSRASSLYSTLNNARRSERPFFQDHVGGDLPLLLLRLDVEEVLPHLEDWYQACWRDLSLLDFATAVRCENREPLLYDLVRRGLESPSYFDQARAISLAGWCGSIPRIHALVEDSATGSGSWLEFLKQQALRRSKHEEWVRSWFRTFLLSRGLAQSFAAFRLFLRCVDRRYYAWREEVYESTSSRAGPTQRQRMSFLSTNRREIEKAIERNEKNLDSHFLGLRIPRERLSPWTGLPSVRSLTPRRHGRMAE